MALILEKTLYNADTVRYWRVGEIKVTGNVVAAVLYGYRNSQHRVLPVNPVAKQTYDFVANDLNQALTEAYNYIKTLPEWANAQDA